MRKHLLFLALVLQFALLLCRPAMGQTVSDRESLKLYGGNSHMLATNADGSYVMVAMQGPYGFFYSTDFGNSWKYAGDTTYKSGEGSAITIIGDNAYATTNEGVFTSALTDPPSWTSITLADKFNARKTTSSGNFLVVAGVDNSSGTTVISYDTVNKTVVDTSVVSTSNDIPASVSVDTTNGYIFVSMGDQQGGRHIYRATFDASTGAITDNWQIKEPATATGYYTHVTVAPDTSDVYVGTQNAPANNGLYISTDHGDSYALVKDYQNNDITGNTSFGFMTGSHYLIGQYYSNDSGTTWYQISQLTEEGSHLNGNAGIINPSDTTKALISSDVGIAKTSDLNHILTSVWNESNSGLEGMIVNGLAQNTSNKNRVVLATQGGAAFTDNFTSTTPTWTFPIFPLGDGSCGRTAVFHPTDNNRVFVGYSSLYEGAIDTTKSAPITWSLGEAADSVNNFIFIRDMKVSGTNLYVAYGSSENTIGGYLKVFDISGTTSKSGEYLTGKHVASVHPISTSTIFAGLGTTSNVTNYLSSDQRGLWKTTNGGSSWTKITSSSVSELANAAIVKLAYDSDRDILYAGAADPEKVGNYTGAFFVIEDASTDSPSVSLASLVTSGTIPNVTSVAVDSATGNVYVSAGSVIYYSSDQGDSWSVFYEGVNDESTSMLFFDDLVQGANTGFWALSSASGLTSPIYASWSGANGQKNIAEIMNKSDSAVTVGVRLVSRTGARSGLKRYRIQAHRQLNVNLNTLPGYGSSSYGLVKIEWSGSAQIDGRTVHYLQTSDRANYQYVYAFPFSSSVVGATFAGYNTYNPSTNTNDTALTENWLYLTNMSDTTQSFIVKKYRATGGQSSSQTIALKPLASKKIEAGHVSPGQHKYGLVSVKPVNGAATYQANLVRLGRTTVSSGNTFAFAIPVQLRAGSEVNEFAFSGNDQNTENYFTVYNASEVSGYAIMSAYNSSNKMVLYKRIYLPRHSLYSRNITPATASTELRWVKVRSDKDNMKVFAENLSYHRDGSGNIVAAYPSATRASVSQTIWGSWSLEYGQKNWLRIANPNSASTLVTTRIYNSKTGTIRVLRKLLGARSTIYYPLHKTGYYRTVANNKGLLKVTSGTASKKVFAEVLRTRNKPTKATELDYATNTYLR